MAKDKKSVLLYCDIIHTIEELSDEEAGRLFKHYLRYVNDLNPTPPDKLTQIVFEPIKQNLKRDLKKWEDKSLKNKDNANKRWNANACERIKSNANYADKDKVIVKDIISNRKLKFSETIKPFVDLYGSEMCNKFFAYWTEPNKSNTKMKFEMQKTWDTKRRLKTWSDNNFNTKPKQPILSGIL